MRLDVSYYFPCETVTEARAIYAEQYAAIQPVKVDPFSSALVKKTNFKNDYIYLRHLANHMNYVFEAIMQCDRLNDSSKSKVLSSILFDCTPFFEFYDEENINQKYGNTTNAYPIMRDYAIKVFAKYEGLSQQLIRENQDSGWNGWKPFFKNLLTLFGLGTSAISRLFYGEYLYGDKLTLPEQCMTALDTPIKLDEILTLSSDDELGSDSEKDLASEKDPLITPFPVSDHIRRQNSPGNISDCSSMEPSPISQSFPW